jgi:hypothetical protein
MDENGPIPEFQPWKVTFEAVDGAIGFTTEIDGTKIIIWLEPTEALRMAGNLYSAARCAMRQRQMRATIGPGEKP